MKYFISWSGGKDSTATIILAHKLGLHIDGIVMSEVMFDHSRNISGEDIEHITWVYNVAIPIIEKTFGYKVIILRDKSDYIQEFNHIVKSSKNANRIGKKVGFFISGLCVGNDRLKMRPLRKFFKEQGEHIQFVGIAIDEPIRLARLKNKTNRRSLLAEHNIKEVDTYDICREYNLLSPTYLTNNRGGCWFCPNSKIKEFAELKLNHPELWEELRTLSKSENMCTKAFKRNKTFEEVDREVDEYIINAKRQISVFDII